MSKTNALKDALITDLNDVTTANGYSQTVAEVSREPIRFDEVKVPHISIVPGDGGSAAPETLTNRIGAAEQEWTLQLVLRTTTPNEDMDDFLDDVRNVIERSTGNLGSTAGVILAAVSSWTGTITAEEIHQNTYYREATVSVQYEYTRGSA